MTKPKPLFVLSLILGMAAAVLIGIITVQVMNRTPSRSNLFGVTGSERKANLS
ncbi:MAG: hypothetical protein R3F07_13780 [Opitutaceae bacterium]